jgi:hypothetical protein
MPRCKCGRRIQSGRLCDQCTLRRLGPQTDDAEHDCPECGGPTSGPDAPCRHCRRGDR